MADFRSWNTYRSAALAQSLRVIVVSPDPAGVYSFTADQDMVFTSVRVDAAESAGDRWAIMHVAGVEKMNARVEPGQTTLTVGPFAVGNGAAVKIRLRGTSAAVSLTIAAAGLTPTQYRLNASKAAPTRWRRVSGAWVPVANDHRRVGAAWPRAEVYRRISGAWLMVGD